MKRVLLLGGGPAHLQVLRELAAQPLAGAQVQLVSPHPRLIHPGMVPGLVAGHYAAADCSVALAPLAQAAGVRLVESSIARLDAAARQLHLAGGEPLAYDVLSIDADPVLDRDAIPGAREHGLFVRPLEHFSQLLAPLLALSERQVLDVVVIGGGAGGVELAMALQYRLAGRGEERARVALVTGGAPALFGQPQRLVERAAAALRRRRITVFRERCSAIEAGAVRLASGARLACDAPVIATTALAPPWLRESGLPLDGQGFVLTGPTLQSGAYPEVLAAGTHGSLAHAQAGAALALNLRRLAAGGELQPLRPPPARALRLVSCGERRAILSYGNWSAAGPWAWWWKDRRDRRFVASLVART